VGTLAAGIAREINNPIGSILLNAQVALRLDPSRHDELQHLLRQIVDQTERCARIVQSVLRFAKRDPAERWTTDINSSVEHAERFVHAEVQRRRGVVTLDLAADLPPIQANPMEIEQVVVNLVLNAIQARERGVNVTISTSIREDVVRIAVVDDGPGIAKERLDNVFDPFYTGREREGGTGLGLSIVRGIVESHGGAIEALSSDQGGTTMVVELPYRLA
jgi:two-component system NtrC family sensor kinase